MKPEWGCPAVPPAPLSYSIRIGFCASKSAFASSKSGFSMMSSGFGVTPVIPIATW